MSDEFHVLSWPPIVTPMPRASRRTVNVDTRRALGDLQADLGFQTAILPGVSRTFALTIPALPQSLADVVANAYLLCRLADTIEDDTRLDNVAKTAFHDRLAAVVRGEADAKQFARDLSPRLSTRTLAAERELVQHSDRVIRITQSFSATDRQTILRCLSKMCHGMPAFQRQRSLRGLSNIDELSAYCYVVAGVVGEMLTELFCAHCPSVSSRRPDLMQLAPSFGQGLQMTNILKDVWEDRRAATCWLPRCVFGAEFDLAKLEDLYSTATYRRGIERLIGIAHRHLRNALAYALLIPKSEPGVRRFCLWAIGLAVLTLRKVVRYCDSRQSARAKISRSAVHATIHAVDLVYQRDRMLRALFALSSTGLPLAPETALPPFGAQLLRRQCDAEPY